MLNNFCSSAKERLILSLSEPEFTAKLSRKLKVTYSHISHIISNLEESNIIIRKKHGRRIYISLTDKGEKIRHHISQIKIISMQNE